MVTRDQPLEVRTEDLGIDEEEALIKDWDSQWFFPGFIAWALWGHLPMPGMDEDYRAQSFMVGDDTSSNPNKTNRSKRGRAASRKEIVADMPSIRTATESSHGSTANIHATVMSVRDHMISDELENSKRFRSSLLDIGELEFQLSCLSRKVEQANHMVMEFRNAVLAKPDIFENP